MQQPVAGVAPALEDLPAQISVTQVPLIPFNN